MHCAAKYIGVVGIVLNLMPVETSTTLWQYPTGTTPMPKQIQPKGTVNNKLYINRVIFYYRYQVPAGTMRAVL